MTRIASRKAASPLHRRTPRQPRAQVTFSFILEAAAQILNAHGKHGFNTNRIAERAGISIGTLYGYFPNKGAIFIALARRIIEEDTQALMQVVEGNHGSETLRLLIRAIIRRHRENAVVRRIVMSTYIAEGFGEEHDTGMEALVLALVEKPERLFGATPPAMTPLRLFTVSRALVGIARGLTEQGNAAKPSDAEIEDEAVALVTSYLMSSHLTASAAPMSVA